jgi:hypothetical protein
MHSVPTDVTTEATAAPTTDQRGWQPAAPLTLTEGAGVLGALVVLLGAQLIFSGALYLFQRHFWLDEIYTYAIVTDPDYGHSLRALAGGVETHPPSFYLLMRAFTSVAGTSESAFRCFALLSVLAALLGIYVILRQAFSPFASLVAVFLVWCHPLVLSHAFDARFYGPWLAATVWFAYFLARARSADWGRLNTVLLAASSVLVCTIHYFGIITLAIIICFELWFHRRPGERHRGMLAAAAGPISLLACVPLLLAQRSSFTVPTWLVNNWPLLLLFLISTLYPLLLALAAIWLYQLFRAREAGFRPGADPPAATALAGLSGLCLLPAALILLSYSAQPVMHPRYALPTVASAAPAIAFLVSRASRRAVIGLFLAFLLLGTIELRQATRAAEHLDEETDRLITAIRTHNPDGITVFEYPNSLYVVTHYAPDLAERCYYLDFDANEIGHTPDFRLFTRDLSRNHARYYEKPRLLAWEKAKQLPRPFLVHDAFYGLLPEDISGLTDLYPGFNPRRVDLGIFELVPVGED